jgi:aldose sugar dehydrogenase
MLRADSRTPNGVLTVGDFSCCAYLSVDDYGSLKICKQQTYLEGYPMAKFKALKEVHQELADDGVRKRRGVTTGMLLMWLLVVTSVDSKRVEAQPTLVDPRLNVRTVVSGLNSPTTMAFLGEGDILVLEKETGRVRRVMNGLIQSTVLDLAVNFGSERGLLGIALHPEFPTNPGVYLYWTESSTGNDTSVLSATSLLGNRVDRFTWDGSTLTLDENIIRLRAIQQDATNPVERGNHDGGVLRFGPDGKLYIFFGDQGRRGQLQNLPDGPFGPGQPDDQFGGPEPDDAHLSGVILRLNDDGTAPADNPFFRFGASVGGDVGANIQKIFSYGHRNSFGMAFDPFSGNLWLQENGDDSFTELNLVEPGMNGGWVQIAGPVERIAQFKQIETSTAIDPIKMSVYFGLQQERWPPTLIADTPAEALSRLFMLPGAHYSDPKLSWKFEVAPAGIGFLDSVALGPRYEGDLFLGEARTFLDAGYLFRLRLNRTRKEIAVRDSALEDKVADNLNTFDITESETLLFGRGFGVGTDIQTGPNGNLFVVSLSNGAIYEIFRDNRR